MQTVEMKTISYSLDDLNKLNHNTMMDHLGIRYTEATPGFIKATMPVDHRTHQPMGLLHGGASAALAESVGSVGSALLVDLDQVSVVGAQITANHLRSVTEGTVTATAKIIHQGKNTHVWNIDITDEKNRMISTCRLTNFIIRK
jgi:1,4-dihydroxy-2-naphthoyl-CoA hydrolase